MLVIIDDVLFLQKIKNKDLTDQIPFQQKLMERTRKAKNY